MLDLFHLFASISLSLNRNTCKIAACSGSLYFSLILTNVSELYSDSDADPHGRWSAFEHFLNTYIPTDSTQRIVSTHAKMYRKECASPDKFSLKVVVHLPYHYILINKPPPLDVNNFLKCSFNFILKFNCLSSEFLATLYLPLHKVFSMRIRMRIGN